jgi:hypothetical protein
MNCRRDCFGCYVVSECSTDSEGADIELVASTVVRLKADAELFGPIPVRTVQQ